MIYSPTKSKRTPQFVMNKELILIGPEISVMLRVDNLGAIDRFYEDRIALFFNKYSQKVWVKEK